MILWKFTFDKIFIYYMQSFKNGCIFAVNLKT